VHTHVQLPTPANPYHGESIHAALKLTKTCISHYELFAHAHPASPASFWSTWSHAPSRSPLNGARHHSCSAPPPSIYQIANKPARRHSTPPTYTSPLIEILLKTRRTYLHELPVLSRPLPINQERHTPRCPRARRCQAVPTPRCPPTFTRMPIHHHCFPHNFMSFPSSVSNLTPSAKMHAQSLAQW
jgi:hypothetical protein